MNAQDPSSHVPPPLPPGLPVEHGGRGSDGGRARSPWWLWVLAAALLGTVTYLQRPDAPDLQRRQEESAGLAPVRAPKGDPLILIGKLAMALRSLDPSSGKMIQAQADAMTGFVTPGVPGMKEPKDPARFSAAERIRATILAGEDLSAEQIEERLNEIESRLDPKSELNDDVQTLREIYLSEEEGAPSSRVRPEDAAELEQRHGWFGRLAMAHGVKDAPVRTSAASDGLLIVGVIALAMTAVGVAVLAGLVVLILGLIGYIGGTVRPRFVRPRAGAEWPADEAGGRASSVWLETAVVFLAGFLGLKLATAGLEAAVPGIDRMTLVWSSLLGQWALVLTIFWPLVRGMPAERYRREIGWHTGEGVLKEVGWGVLGYCAGLPIYFAVAIVVVLIMFIIQAATGGDALAPDSNKIVDIVEGGTPAMLAAVYLLATVWAPVVEESIFRGALYRHLRRRWPVVLAALGSASVFAVLHGYMAAQLFIVGTLGFWFAIIREWRGTLIPSVVGHFIHNGFVLALIIVVMSLAGG